MFSVKYQISSTASFCKIVGNQTIELRKIDFVNKQKSPLYLFIPKGSNVINSTYVV